MPQGSASPSLQQQRRRPPDDRRRQLRLRLEQVLDHYLTYGGCIIIREHAGNDQVSVFGKELVTAFIVDKP